MTTVTDSDIKELKDLIINLREDIKGLKIGQVELKEDIKKVEIRQVDLKGDIKTLDATVGGLGKRLENQEFTNRGILIALIVALIGGAAKLFGLAGDP